MADIKTIFESNVTDNSTDITIEELNAIETNKYIGVLIFYVALMIVGIFGNLVVLVIYKFKFKRTRARTYILALAVADLSVGLVGIPYHTLDLTMLLVYKYTYLCKIMTFLLSACTQSSVCILLVVGLDRFLKVVRPLKKQIVDYVGERCGCLIAAAVGILVSVPNAILYGPRTVPTKIEGLSGVECFIDDSFVEETFTIAYFGFIIVIFVVSFLFLSVIYTIICVKIYQRDKRNEDMELRKSQASFSRNNTTREMSSHSQSKKKHSTKITVMMLTISAIFIFSYLPYIIMSILTAMIDDFWESMEYSESVLSNLALRMYLVNNVTNPIVYSFWDLRFRSECLTLLTYLCGCKTADWISRYRISTGNSSSNRKTATTKSTL